MPNQKNFRSDVTSKLDPSILASRVSKFDNEGVLLQEIPASFGFGPNNNVELHFYSIPENSLLLSTTVSLSDISPPSGSINDVYDGNEKTLKVLVVYDQDNYTNFLRINYTKLFEEKQLSIIPGDYKVTINFFDSEIGTYYDRNIYLTKISPNRTEVELAFVDSTAGQFDINEEILREFIEESLPKPYAIGAAEQIFDTAFNVVDDDFGEGITYEKIIDRIDETTVNRLNNLYQSFEQEGIDLKEPLKDYINLALSGMYLKMRETILQRVGDYRIQESEFELFIDDIVNSGSSIQFAQNVVDSKQRYTDVTPPPRDIRIILQ